MNIFISNLNFKVTDVELRLLFEEFGEVSSAKVIMEKFTGRSRGFGFVEMTIETEAQKAIETLNQSSFMDKIINVSIAKPRTEQRDNNHSDKKNRNNF